MIQGRGQEQRDQAGSVDAAGNDPPGIGDADRQIEHPRKTGNTQDQAGAMANRVDKLLGRTVLRLCVLNDYLSSGVLQSPASKNVGMRAEQRILLL